MNLEFSNTVIHGSCPSRLLAQCAAVKYVFNFTCAHHPRRRSSDVLYLRSLSFMHPAAPSSRVFSYSLKLSALPCFPNCIVSPMQCPSFCLLLHSLFLNSPCEAEVHASTNYLDSFVCHCMDLYSLMFSLFSIATEPPENLAFFISFLNHFDFLDNAPLATI